MIELHILLVEDDKDIQASFVDTVKIFNERETANEAKRQQNIEKALTGLRQAEAEFNAAALEANSEDKTLKKTEKRLKDELDSKKKAYDKLLKPDSAIDALDNHKKKSVEVIIKNNLQEVKELTVKDFLNIDIIIMDIHLGKDEPEGGNQAIEFLASLYSRTPIICVSGTPESIMDHPLIIHKRARDTGDYEQDILFALKVKMTGLIDVLKGKGHINKTIYNALTLSVTPNLKEWLGYIDFLQYEHIRDGIFRVFSNHINKILENSEESFILQEFYLNLTEEEIRNKNIIKTGYILKSKEVYYVALNPPCDLTLRKDGDCKADRLFLCEVESFAKYIENNYNDAYQKDNNKEKFIKTKLESLIKNNASHNHHFLPKNTFFEYSCLDFVKIKTILQDELEANYGIEPIMIAPSFVANITSRLAAYYARQGQPDIRLTKTQQDAVITATVSALNSTLATP
ncbi:MAG: hypothetical protein E6Q83_03325 [Thiothrix sp.]|nr:MAG: hypothetical protein E6Q83_03325 [Thiothrix sp.]